MTRSSILILGFLLLLGIHPVCAENFQTKVQSQHESQSQSSPKSFKFSSVSAKKQMYAPSAQQQHASRSQKADHLLKHFQSLELKVKKTSSLDFPTLQSDPSSKDKYKLLQYSKLDQNINFASQYLKSPLDKPPRKGC
jgi:hypothetical protein